MQLIVKNKLPKFSFLWPDLEDYMTIFDTKEYTLNCHVLFQWPMNKIFLLIYFLPHYWLKKFVYH
jgi:hypothetical protein